MSHFRRTRRAVVVVAAGTFGLVGFASTAGAATDPDAPSDGPTAHETHARPNPATSPYLGWRLRPSRDGVTVIHVVADGPAAAAGVEVGDTIVSIGDVTLDHRGALGEAFDAVDVGESVVVVTLHDGSEETVTIVAGSPDDRPVRADRPAPEDRPYLGVRLEYDGDSDGLTVRAVIPGSPAEAAGVLAGDVLVSIDGTELSGLESLRTVAQEHAPGDTVSVTVDRDGSAVTLSVELGSQADRPHRTERPQGEGRQEGGRAGGATAVGFPV